MHLVRKGERGERLLKGGSIGKSILKKRGERGVANGEYEYGVGIEGEASREH